jgi:regulator of sigma E protease
VLSAGSIMNAIIPFLLLALAFMVPHDVATAKVVVDEVSPNSPAEQAGIVAGDAILEINHHAIGYNGDLAYYIFMYLGTEIPILVEHADGTQEVVEATPRWRPPADDGAVGIGTINENLVVNKISEPFWRAIPMGVVQAAENMVIFKNSILSLFIGTASVVDLTGPVGIAQISGEVAKSGWYSFLQWTALLSLNLAIVNILPLPALDGGRIAFVLLEWLRRGKRISPHKEGLVHAIGFMLLLALIAAVTFQDILHIAQSGSVLP